MAFSNGAETIEIRVQVDNTGAVKLLGQTEEKIGDVGKAAKKTSTATDEFFTSFVKGATTAIGSAFTFQKAIEGIKLGSEIDDISQAFNNIAAQAGVLSNVLLSDLKRATAGTISDFDLMKEANQSMLAGLDPTKFASTAEQVRKLGEAMGVDLKEGIDIVNQALITGNDRALKMRLGLNVDLEASERLLKEAYGNTNIQLSEAARLGSAQIAILSALEQKTSGIAAVTDDAADLISQMGVSIENARNRALEKIATDQILIETLTSLKSGIENIDWGGFITGATNAATAVINFAEKGILTLAEALENLRRASTAEQSGFLYWQKDFKSVGTEIEDFNKKMLDVVDLLSKDTPQSTEKAREAFVNLGAELSKLAPVVGLQLKKSFDELAKNFPEVAKKGNDVANSNKNQSDKAAQLRAELEKLQKALGSSGIANAQEIAKKATEAHTKAIIEADAHVQQYQKHLEELANRSPTELMGEQMSGIMSDVFGGTLGLSDEATAQLAMSLGDAVFSGIQNGLTRESLVGIAGDAGNALGMAFGIPFAGQIASFYAEALSKIGTNSKDSLVGIVDTMFPGLGTIAGEVFGDAFGDSAGTKTKKELDKIFADAFKDLTFSGNQDPTQGLFASLTQEAQAQFTALGDTITQALGFGIDSGVNLGVVLANNNITLAEMGQVLSDLGLSFDELSATMVQAFYNGELSALDLQNRLEELYGIINGSTAFANLGEAVNAAFNSDGRQLLGALKAIGAQAQSTGVTLGQMPDILQNKFGVAADRVQQLMAAMAAAGIKSVADLANAANPVLIALAANVQQASQGITPDNTAVTTARSTPSGTSGTSGSSGNTGSSSSTRTPTQHSTRTSSRPRGETPEQKAAKARAEILKIFNQVTNSQVGKDLDAKIQVGLINDQQYADAINKLVSQATQLQKKVDKEQKDYLDAVRKKGENPLKEIKELKEFEKAKQELDKLLGKAEEKFFLGNRPLIDFMKQFRGQTELLNIAAQAAGVSFQKIQQNAENAFLSGKQSFAEAKKAIDELTGGKDAKAQFDKFRGLGTKGGALSIDAFKDIGKAIQNAGGTDLNSLSEFLLGQGADRSQVQQFFIALQNSGIDSLDAIANASTETVITVGNQLQDLKFPFSETSNYAQGILDQLDQIRNSDVKAKINLSVDISDEDRQLLLGYGLIKPGDIGTNTTASIPYTDTSLGIKEQKALAKYNKLIKQGKLKEAQKFKDKSPYV